MANIMVATNDLDSLTFTKMDRRFEVVGTIKPPLQKELYDRIAKFKNTQPKRCAGVMNWFFKNCIPFAAVKEQELYGTPVVFDDFNEQMRAQETAQKEIAISDNRHDFIVWLEEEYCPVPDSDGGKEIGCDLVSLETLLNKWNSISADTKRPYLTRATAVQLMRKAGCVNREHVMLSDGRKKRLWSVRNNEAWLEASHKDWAMEFER